MKFGGGGRGHEAMSHDVREKISGSVFPDVITHFLGNSTSHPKFSTRSPNITKISS